MAGNKNIKLKLLRTIDILNEKSDEEHPISAGDICDALSEFDIEAERKSVYSDLDLLEEYGMDVIRTQKGAYIGERDFQLAEVRLLIDAVQSAKFITEKKTEELTKKIVRNLSKHQIESLSKQVYVDHRNKNVNEMVYIVIDTLYKAATAEKKVRIHYQKRVIATGEKPKNEDHIYTVSPYALIWSDDHYYLVCNNNKYDNLMHLRIDRILHAYPLDEPARPLREVSPYTDHFDAADYASKTFNMFSGEVENIKLCCNNSLWEIVRDRFGDNVRIIDRTDDTFTISTVVAISSGLTSWIMQYSTEMIVVSPDSLRDEIIKKSESTLLAYKKED